MQLLVLHRWLQVSLTNAEEVFGTLDDQAKTTRSHGL